MKLEQHIYTSGKTEFTTVAMTKGLSRNERIKLETNSIYFLPVSLHYQEDITTPVKYVCYPLNEDRFVVGKAVYIGKDSLGRTGNYLFHNIIASKEDLMTSCRFNPTKLMTWLEENQVFRNEVSGQPVEVFELSPDDLNKPSPSPRSISRDLLLQVLYLCLQYETVHQPLLLIGTQNECLEFLDHLYLILPYHIREELCVDTYAYGVSLGFQIIGSPEEQEFQQGLTSSLTLRLADLQYTSYLDMPAPSKHLAFVTDMAATERIDELDAVYSLEYCLRREHYERFKREYRTISPEMQEVIWDFHEATLLKYLVTELDTELLLMVQEKLSIEDIDILYAAPEMINHLVETGDRKNLALIADWLCTEGDKMLFYPFLFKSSALWKVFLERIRSQPRDAGFLLEPFKAFQGYYSKEFEGELLEEMLLVLPYIQEEKKLAKDFFKAFEMLPEMDTTSEPVLSEVEGEASISLPSDGDHLQSSAHLLLRTFIKYELSKDPDILELLIDSDLSVFPEQQQTMIFNSILDKVLVLRSLKLWNSDKVEQQVRRLFKHTQENRALLLTLLTSIEKLEFSGESRKVLEKVFSDLLANLPKDKTSKQIQSLIERILKPPTSLFKRITQKLLRLRGL